MRDIIDGCNNLIPLAQTGFSLKILDLHPEALSVKECPCMYVLIHLVLGYLIQDEGLRGVQGRPKLDVFIHKVAGQSREGQHIRC